MREGMCKRHKLKDEKKNREGGRRGAKKEGKYNLSGSVKNERT